MRFRFASCGRVGLIGSGLGSAFAESLSSGSDGRGKQSQTLSHLRTSAELLDRFALTSID